MGSYTFGLGSMTWDQCHDACEEQGEIMLCIQNEEQNSYIFQQLGSDYQAWIGYSDAATEVGLTAVHHTST